MREDHVKEVMLFLMRPWIGTCAEAEARLSDHLDGDLSPSEERRLRRHLARCRGCASVYDSLTRAVESLRSLGREGLDTSVPSVAEAVAQRIRHEPQ